MASEQQSSLLHDKSVISWQDRIGTELSTTSGSCRNYRHQYSLRCGRWRWYTWFLPRQIYRLYQTTVHWTSSTTARSQYFQQSSRQMAQAHILVDSSLVQNSAGRCGFRQISRAESGRGMFPLLLNRWPFQYLLLIMVLCWWHFFQTDMPYI